MISADADFGNILAVKGWQGPSMIFFRRISHRPEKQAQMLVANLKRITPYLEQGCIIVFERGRIRLRPYNPD